MRVTRVQLQEMIDEEVAAALLRVENRRLTESNCHGAYDCGMHELFEFAQIYSSLTQSQKETLHAVVSGRGCLVEQASVLTKKFGGMNRELDEAMAVIRA